MSRRQGWRYFWTGQVLAVGNLISLLNDDSYKRGEVLELSIALNPFPLYSP